MLFFYWCQDVDFAGADPAALYSELCDYICFDPDDWQTAVDPDTPDWLEDAIIDTALLATDYDKTRRTRCTTRQLSWAAVADPVALPVALLSTKTTAGSSTVVLAGRTPT